MTTIILKIKKLCEQAILPSYQTEHSSGLDLHACVKKPLTLKSGKYIDIPTGIAAEIPCGFEGQVRPRSGLALKYGVTVLNSPGTIDSDYRGEIRVIIINHGLDDYTINNGDRIAQLVISPVTHAEISEYKNLSDTKRNTGGFGHTGISQ